MPVIKWKTNTKIHNKALGIEGPVVDYAPAGAEMTVSEATLKAIQDRYAPELYEVVKAATKTSKSTRGRSDA